MFAWVFFVVGGAICGLNVWLAWVQPSIRWLRGERRRNDSVYPIFGSLLILLSLPWLQASATVERIGIGLALLDAGGLHWFLAILAWMHWFRRPGA